MQRGAAWHQDLHPDEMKHEIVKFHDKGKNSWKWLGIYGKMQDEREIVSEMREMIAKINADGV